MPDPVDLGLHGAPSAASLVEAVREWLERDVMPGTTGRLSFHARVAANVLSMVERELEFGAGQAVEHAARMAALGVSDDVELSAAIRSGQMDDRLSQVRAAVLSAVEAKLAVANPKYLAR